MATKSRYTCNNPQCNNKWHYVGTNCSKNSRSSSRKPMFPKSRPSLPTRVAKKGARKAQRGIMGKLRRLVRKYPVATAVVSSVAVVAVFPTATPFVGIGLGLYIMVKKMF